MINVGRAVFSLLTDSTKFEAAMDTAGEKAKGLGGKLAALGPVARVAIGATFTEGVSLLGQFARSAAEDEVTVVGLQQAIENTGTNLEAWQDAIDGAIKKNQELGVSDEQTRGALQALVQTTGDTGRALDLLGLATDIARAKHLDLSTAATLVGRVAEGNVAILTRYGIQVDKNASSGEALAELQKRFAGQAEAYGNTTAGAVDKMRDRISEWGESIGYAIGPAAQFIGLMPGMSLGLGAVGGALGKVTPAVMGWVSSLWSSLPAIGATIIAMGPILLPIAAIAAAIALLALAWANDWGGIQEKAQAVLSFVQGAIESFQRDGLGGLLSYLAGFAGQAWEAMLNVGRSVVDGLMNGLAGLAGAVWNALVSAFSAIDFWVGPFHVTSSGVTISLPSISFPSIGAAGGFEGLVTRPTMFTVAEAGSEYVSVTPHGQTPESGGGGAGHGHDVIMDGQLVASLIGRRYVRGAAAAGGAIG